MSGAPRATRIRPSVADGHRPHQPRCRWGALCLGRVCLIVGICLRYGGRGPNDSPACPEDGDVGRWHVQNLEIRTHSDPQYGSRELWRVMQEMCPKHEPVREGTPEHNWHVESFRGLLRRECVWPYGFARFRDRGMPCRGRLWTTGTGYTRRRDAPLRCQVVRT